MTISGRPVLPPETFAVIGFGGSLRNANTVKDMM
jgi:hypothetical protein